MPYIMTANGGSQYVPDDSPLIQGGSVDYPGGNSPLNPQQFATQSEAERLAKRYGGTVSGDQLGGPGYGYLGPDGTPITQQQLNIPGAPSQMNAGLVSGALTNSPGDYGEYLVGRDAGGEYGPSPYDTKVGNIAMGWSADGRYVPLSTSTAQNPVTAGAASAPGAGGVARNSAPKGSVPFDPNAPWNPGASGSSAAAPGATRPGGAPAGPGGIQRPTPATPGAPVVPPRLSQLQVANSRGGFTGSIPANGQAPTAGGVTDGPGTSGGGGAPGYSGYGYVPSGSGYAPNSGYPNFVNQYPSPQATDPYGYPYAIPPVYNQENGEGLQYKSESDRTMAIQQGLGLQRDLQGYTGYQQGRANDYEGAANSAYGGIASGYGGYSDAEKGAVQQQGALNAMQLTPEQQQQNYLSGEEQQGISGDPYAPFRQLGLDEAQIDDSTGQRGGNVRGALDMQDQGIDAGLNAAGTNVRNAIYDNRAKQYQNLSDTAALTRDQQNQATSNVRGALNYGEDTTRSYIDPAKLGLSPEYQRDYNVGERDLQNIRDKAGRAVGSQTAMDEERLMMDANAAGNTSPLALAAARAKLRQQGAVNSANAMSDAEIAAKRLQLDTSQQRENTRLGAEGNLANLGTGTELALGGRRSAAEQTLGSQGLSNEQQLGNATIGTQSTLGAAEQGAEQYLANQQQQAEQFKGGARVGAEQTLGAAATDAEKFKTSTNLGAGQTAEKAGSDRAAQIATNRQATSVGNQGADLARQQYAYGQTAANNTNFANQRRGDEAEYRNYLTGQGTQANQNAQVGNQQRLSAFGTQLGAQNAATGNAITNSKTPGMGEKIAGMLLAKGGAVSGPTKALVGEEGPELVIDLMPHYGDGGVVDSYGAQDYGMGQPDYGDTMTGPLPSRAQIAQTATIKKNPLYLDMLQKLTRQGDPQGLYPQDSAGAGGGSLGLGKQLTSGLISKAMGALFPVPAAKGGVFGQKGGHPYGKRGAPHLRAELVTHPQVRMLGETSPTAVIPLNNKKGNRTHMSDLPKLVQQYSGYGK